MSMKLIGKVGLLLLLALLVVACGAQPAPQQAETAAQTEQDEEAHDDEHSEHSDEEAHDDEHSDDEHSEHDDEHSEHDDEHSEHDAHSDDEHDAHSDHDHGEEMAALVADLTAVTLAEGEQLQVVASTTIIGDWVVNVAGDAVDLTVLMPIGADLHGFEPTPQDLIAIADADVVFVNGLNAEEALMESLENAGSDAPVIPLATGLETREMAEGDSHEHGDEHGDEAHDDHSDEHGEHDEHSDEEHADEEHADEEHADEEHDDHAHDHSGGDPHVWTTPFNAMTMVWNIELALAALDPANAETYAANAEAYVAELEALDGWVQSQIDTIPADNRELVTDHRAFGYYADRYGLTQVGAVLPAFSTNTEPSAQELAELQDAIVAYEVPAIFVGTTVTPDMSAQIAQDTGIQLITVYTGSLGPEGSGAETFTQYIEYNTNAFVTGLSQ